MSVKALCNRSCTIVHRIPSGTTDDYGDPVPSESYTETTCELQQTQRDEPGDEGELSVTTWSLFLWDLSVDLDTSDAVIVDGVEYEFVGDPWVADSGSPAVHHIEATVKETGRSVGS